MLPIFRGWSSDPYAAALTSFDHRAAAAFLAISFRFLLVRDSARATPPFALPVTSAMNAFLQNMPALYMRTRVMQVYACNIGPSVHNASMIERMHLQKRPAGLSAGGNGLLKAQWPTLNRSVA